MNPDKAKYKHTAITRFSAAPKATFVNCCSVIIFLAVCLFADIAFAENKKEQAIQDTGLLVYLPRTIAVETSRFNLGQIGIIHGKARLCEKANKISLGRISLPGQKITINKTVVLSRLASKGITASKITMVGADKTIVSQKNNVVESEQFIEAAESFLKSLLSSSSVRELKTVIEPEGLVIPEQAGDFKLSARLLEGGGSGTARVEICALQGERILGKRRINFRVKYNRPRAVALVDIPRGATITKDNVAVKQMVCDSPAPAGWSPPYESIARRPIDANSVITSHMLSTPRPKAVINRNETITILVERPGLLVSAIGKALQKGSTGEYIKVRNEDSKRIIIAKVKADGTVEPVF